MNAVEIEEAVSQLAEQPFDADAFPFAFLEAFGNKETTLKRLRSGATNQSDIDGAVLQRNNIHLKVSPEGEVSTTLVALRESPATQKQKAKFILATDGNTLEAENLEDGDAPLVCSYQEISDHFGYFLPLAGITTVKQIRENAFDIKATGRLNRLYVELLKENTDWDSEARREDLNHFMARLIFCFFAEDTGIFGAEARFTTAVEQMSTRDSSNTHEVIAELFRAMNLKHSDREAAGIKSWAKCFPYVNGNLFSGNLEVPRFSKIARSYFLHVGKLDWTQINPDIFGSMIQAVADDKERGALGMHYTSVPNILKVLNPLFLDELREKLEEAGDNARKLQALRRRISRIRVFDPACGSGNFLVIAYKEMRAIEAEINKRLKEADRRSEIPKTNFRGIEIRHFSCEIARLALIIAEYQCDVVYRGQHLALAEFLPLDAENWIACGNALRMEWANVCPPSGKVGSNRSSDLFADVAPSKRVGFENEGGETYICGNPPYAGKGKKSAAQVSDMEFVFKDQGVKHGYLDYVGCWFAKAVDYGNLTKCDCAFVTTNSLCQGHQVPLIWPLVLRAGYRITFAHTSFKWSNLASHNAGVTVVIVGLSAAPPANRKLFYKSDDGALLTKQVPYINSYLVAAQEVLVLQRRQPFGEVSPMDLGNMPYDGGNLLLTRKELNDLGLTAQQKTLIVRRIYGSQEFISNVERYCLWIENKHLDLARESQLIAQRIDNVCAMRLASSDSGANNMAKRSHQMREMRSANTHTIVMPRTSSESRHYLPAGLLEASKIISSEAFALFDAPLWQLAVLTSRMHLIWIATVCGQLETRYRYSNVLGWNTFPMPMLTAQNKMDLNECAQRILLARETCFPATIAELYESGKTPEQLQAAHESNDETFERAYIGRRFRNDSERLEKLFELYAATLSKQPTTKKLRSKK